MEINSKILKVLLKDAEFIEDSVSEDLLLLAFEKNNETFGFEWNLKTTPPKEIKNIVSLVVWLDKPHQEKGKIVYNLKTEVLIKIMPCLESEDFEDVGIIERVFSAVDWEELPERIKTRKILTKPVRSGVTALHYMALDGCFFNTFKYIKPIDLTIKNKKGKSPLSLYLDVRNKTEERVINWISKKIELLPYLKDMKKDGTIEASKIHRLENLINRMESFKRIKEEEGIEI